MRILYLNFNPVANRVLGFAEGMAALGHTPTVIAVSRTAHFVPTWIQANGVLRGEMPNFPKRYLGYGPIDIFLRMAHIQTHHYDVIHTIDHKPNSYGCGYLGKRKHTIFINDWLDLWNTEGGLNTMRSHRFPLLYRLEAKWERESKLRADGVVTISHYLRERAIQMGCDPQKVISLPNGCETVGLPFLDVVAARKKLNVPLERKIMGYLGMGIVESEMHILMKTLQALPEVWLMVIGPPNALWQATAQYYGVQDRLWSTGFVRDDEVHLYLSCANVAVVPLATHAASQARLAGKLMSYMIAGRPTVTTPVGETARVVLENKIGLVAEPEQYPQAVQSLLSNPSFATELGCNARTAAETNFSNRHLAQSLAKFYERLQVSHLS